MAAIAKDAPAATETARATTVTSIDAARLAREKKAVVQKKSGGLKIGVAVAAALALAASVFVFRQHRNDESPMALAPPAPPAQAAPASGRPGTGVAIESGW